MEVLAGLNRASTSSPGPPRPGWCALNIRQRSSKGSGGNWQAGRRDPHRGSHGAMAQRPHPERPPLGANEPGEAGDIIFDYVQAGGGSPEAEPKDQC